MHRAIEMSSGSKKLPEVEITIYDDGEFRWFFILKFLKIKQFHVVGDAEEIEIVNAVKPYVMLCWETKSEYLAWQIMKDIMLQKFFIFMRWDKAFRVKMRNILWKMKTYTPRLSEEDIERALEQLGGAIDLYAARGYC